MSDDQDKAPRTRLPQPLLALLRRGAAAAGAAAVIATAVPAASGQDAPLDNDSVEQTDTSDGTEADSDDSEDVELSVQEIEERVRLKLELYGPQPVHVAPTPGVPPHGNGWDPCPPCGMG